MNNKNILAIMSGLLVCLLLTSTAVALEAPVVLSATTMDADGNGSIDAYNITFSTDVTNFNQSKWHVAGYEISGNESHGSYVYLKLTEIEGYDTGERPALTVEEGGVSGLAADSDIEELDGAAPYLISATTVDRDCDNKIDGYDLVFSEALDYTSVTTDKWDFNYEGRTSYSLDYTEGDTVVYMTFTEDPDAPDTSSTPSLETVGEVDDIFGNDLATGVIDVKDGVSPVITTVCSDANEPGVLGIGDTITFTIGLVDPMDFDSADSSTYNDAELTWTQDEVTDAITATYTVTEGEDDQATPLQLCNINVTDAAGNPAVNADTIDVQKTIDANRPEVLNATTCDRDADGMIDAYKIVFDENVNDSSLAFGACAVDGYVLLPGLAGFATGEYGNDSIIYILFTEISYDTNALPNVTADADAISDLAGNGIAAVVAEDVTEEDGAAPVILSIASEAHEDDGDGILGLNDYINFTVAPSLPADVDHINTSCFNGVELEWTEGLDGSWTATYTVLEGHTSSMDAQLTGVYATDAAGNAGQVLNHGATYTINAGGPIIISAVTMDRDHNGLIDGYNVSFIDAINDCTVNMSNWNVEGHIVCESWSTGDVANDSNIYIYFNEVAEDNTAALPNLTISNPEVTDMDGDALKAEFCDDNDDITETDGAAPVLMYAYIDSDDSCCDEYEIDVYFSEDVTEILGNVSFKEGYEDLYYDGYDGYMTYMSSEGTSWTFDYDGQLQTGDCPEITAVNNMMDTADNAAVLYGDCGVVVNTFRKEIVEGYNFVSFPIADEGEVTLADVGLDDECKVAHVWMYDAEEGKFIPDTFEDFEIEGGLGYIIEANEDFVLAPNVNNYPAEFETPASTTVYEGWNLVGHYRAHDQCTFGAFETLMGGSIFEEFNINSVMYGQRTAGDLGLIELNAYNDEDRDIVTGNAYWINVDEEDLYSAGTSYGFIGFK